MRSRKPMACRVADRVDPTHRRAQRAALEFMSRKKGLQAQRVEPMAQRVALWRSAMPPFVRLRNPLNLPARGFLRRLQPLGVDGLALRIWPRRRPRLWMLNSRLAPASANVALLRPVQAPTMETRKIALPEGDLDPHVCKAEGACSDVAGKRPFLGRHQPTEQLPQLAGDSLDPGRQRRQPCFQLGYRS